MPSPKPITYVVRNTDSLAMVAAAVRHMIDPGGQHETVALGEGEGFPDRPGRVVVVLFSYETEYPGNHLRVLRHDDTTGTGKWHFRRPDWVPTSVPIHHCVALKPRTDRGDNPEFWEALRTVYNHFTGAKIKQRGELKTVQSAPPSHRGGLKGEAVA